MALPIKPIDRPISAAPQPKRRWWVVPVFLLGMAINCGLLLLFVIDPLGWLGTSSSAAGEKDGYVVFLADDGDAETQRRYFTANPDVEVTHKGTVLNTLLVRFKGETAPALKQLRAQSFVSLVARGTSAVCK